MDDQHTELIALYAQIADMTKAACDTCETAHRKSPYRCCEAWACDLAMAFSSWRWNVDLRPTGNALPLMQEGGCQTAPHLRPACAKHLCEETAKKMPEDYWELKRKISELESAVFGVPS